MTLVRALSRRELAAVRGLARVGGHVRYYSPLQTIATRGRSSCYASATLPTVQDPFWASSSVAGLRFSTKVEKTVSETEAKVNDAASTASAHASEAADTAQKKAEDIAQKIDGAATVSKAGDSGKAESKALEKASAEKKAKGKLTVWEKVKKEAKHYWDGTKLLGYEIKVSFFLALKMARGSHLSRREDRQLKRTVQDIIRLVPFSMFVLVPFAELLLPIALKLFPNMLPSTYESGKSREAKSNKLSDTRAKVSSYLQETVGGPKMKVRPWTDEEADQFKRFFRLTASGEQPPRELVLSVARKFKDDLLLDNLSRSQLAALARYMGLQPYGTSTVLRYLIRHRMRQVKADDYVINSEGVDSLNTQELQAACQSRGFRVRGVSVGRLREDLGNWLQLRLKDKVPSTVLIMSAAYSYDNHDIDSYLEGVSAVLAALPLEVYHEAELEASSEEATNEQRLEVLKEQQEMIEDENKEDENSGHVINVQDNLNVDDDHEPETSESKGHPDEPAPASAHAQSKDTVQASGKKE